MALYDDIGGARAVRAVLDAFYPRCSRTRRSAPSSSAWISSGSRRLKRRTSRWRWVAPALTLDELSITPHLRTRRRGANDAVFDHFLAVFEGVLVDLGVPHRKIGEWIAVIEGARSQILNPVGC